MSVLQGTDSLHSLLRKLEAFILFIFYFLTFFFSSFFTESSFFSFDLLGSVRGACSGEIELLSQPIGACICAFEV